LEEYRMEGGIGVSCFRLESDT